VKFEPRPHQAVGRVVLRTVASSTIVRPDESKGTTKFMLLDAVGSDFEKEGFRVGDIVVPQKVSSVVMEGGASFRAILDLDDILVTVRDWSSLDEFRVQTESGSEYVAFSDPRAAPSLGYTLERHAAPDRTPRAVPAS
jgi:hypothetical protein